MPFEPQNQEPKPLSNHDEKYSSAASEAAKEAWKESFGRKSFLEKLSPVNLLRFPILFVKNWFSETMNVKKQREELKYKTEQKLTLQALGAPTDKLASAMTDEFAKEAKIGENDEDARSDINLFTTSMVDALKSSGDPAAAVSGFDKIKKATDSKKDPKNLTDRESDELASVEILTLANLRERFSTKSALENYLKELQRLGRKSDKMRNLLEYFKKHSASLFALNADKLGAKLGIPDREFEEAESPKEKMRVLAIKLFPDSVEEHGLPKIIRILAGAMESKGVLDIGQIADLAFLIEKDELVGLAERVAPKKAYGGSGRGYGPRGRDEYKEAA